MSLVLLADGLTRIRNGQHSRLDTVRLRYSKFVYSVLEVLVNQGYIEECFVTEEDGFKVIDVHLAYYNGQPVIKLLKMISKPSCEIYSSIKALKKSFNGLGIKILSTSRGVVTDSEAREMGIGGKVLCEIF